MMEISANSPLAAPSQLSQQQLGQTDFLRLMTTQLQAQDPFNPVDNQAMVAQMAQFSSLAGISEMNLSLRGIAEQLGAQTQLLGAIQNSIRSGAPDEPSPQ